MAIVPGPQQTSRQQEPVAAEPASPRSAAAAPDRTGDAFSPRAVLVASDDPLGNLLQRAVAMRTTARSGAPGAVVQRVPGLGARTHVRVSGAGPAWYGEVVAPLDGGYRVRLGGSDTEFDVPEAQVHESSLLASMVHVVRRSEWEGAPLVRGLTIPRMDLEGKNAKQFSQWLAGTVRVPMAMNCYAAVLYAAHRAGLVDRDYIFRALQPQSYDDEAEMTFGLTIPRFIDRMIAAAKAAGRVETATDREAKAFHSVPVLSIVLFGAGGHVALSCGGRRIIELDKHAKGFSTIDEAVERGGSAYRTVRWGPLPNL